MLTLTDAEREALEALAADQSGRSRGAKRARIIILLSNGVSGEEVCRLVGCSRQTVVAWRRRFEGLRLSGLGRMTRRRQ